MKVRVVKENKGAVIESPLSVWALVAALAGTAAAVAALTLIDSALPEPLGPQNAPPDVFHADSAYKFLVNLTSIGPRVAGTYENEVLGMNVALTALREAERGASKHNRLLIDRHRASGAFELTFLDGMNNVYRGVQSVVARVEAVGSSPAAREPALLLNCHLDTVPDSPGASDDGAGCAVVVGAVRALLAGAAPLRRPVVALLNGAEENIMQASHAFVTQHRWAADARVFLNLEACGAGGREVLFQAGPADPWLLDAYARHVPHPFASSVAQELFDSGLVPADTDFRVFRDFGNLSGLDLAWSANGYVYHTRLDTAERVGPAVLQRTGDNVLALVRALLESPAMDAPPDRSPPPVFFDVLGAAVATVPAPAAPALAALTLLLLPLKLHLGAREAQRHLHVPLRWWWRGAAAAGGAVALAGAAGGAAAAAAGAALHAAGLRLPYFARPLLIAPLFAFPALAATLLVFVALHERRAQHGWWRVARRGWWAALSAADGCALVAGALLAAAALARLRSGFLPALWLALPAAVDAPAAALRLPPAARLALAAAAAAAAALQTCYLALGTLRLLVPVMARAGAAGPLPPDAVLGGAAGALAVAACGWALPLALAADARRVRRLAAALLAAAALAAALQAVPRAPGWQYGPAAPQRLMVFHTRRTVAGAPPETLYWVPELDANTLDTARRAMGARPADDLAAECDRLLYCGAPYYLPVLSFIPRGYWAPAPGPPPEVRVAVRASLAAAGAGEGPRRLRVAVGAAPTHVVVIAAVAAGARVTRYEVAAAAGRAPALSGTPLAGPQWRGRNTYFFFLHDASEPLAEWELVLDVEGLGSCSARRCAWLSVAGHALGGELRLSRPLAALLAAQPDWIAATGWSVDLHLLDL